MIRSYFGINRNPFSVDQFELLKHQQQVYEILKVHSSQGGLCVLIGVPGTGKSVIKNSIVNNADKTMLVATIKRTMHTYTNTVKVLCEAFNIESQGTAYKCESKLIEEAYNLKRSGKSLITIIDDAHLLEMENLRKLRLLFEDFPPNHNLILIGEPILLSKINLSVNEDIKSRITYSHALKRIHKDDMMEYIFKQLDQVKLGHNIFTEEALDLIIRSADGLIRRARNLCLSSLLEAVRNQTKVIDLKIVNTVLIQPHWRKEFDLL